MTRAGDVTGVILAGGQARRMGGTDKGLLELAGRPMIEHVLERLEPQVEALFINANRNLDQYRHYGHPVIPDRDGDFSGPLAGMASAMAAAHTRYIVTAPCDSPLLPEDLAVRLLSALQQQQADIAVVHDGERLQPVFALLSVALHDNLEQALSAGERKIDRWYGRHSMASADFSDCKAAFRNVNTPQDLEELAQQLQAPSRRHAP